MRLYQTSPSSSSRSELFLLRVWTRSPSSRTLIKTTRRRTSTVVRRIADFYHYLDLDYSKYLSSDGPMTSPVIHKNMKRMHSRR